MNAQQRRPTLAVAQQDSELAGRRRDFTAFEQSDGFLYDANHIEYRISPVAYWRAIFELYSRCIVAEVFVWL
jgi:hypothetical protein